MGIDANSSEAAAWLGLVEGIANGAYAFVGAGVSAGLGYPMWGALLDHLHDVCVAKGIDASELAAIKATSVLVRAHLYERAITRPRVLEEIGKLYGPRSQKTSPIHAALVNVGFDHYLTTNYDLLIESSHETSGIRTQSLELKQPEALRFLRATHSRKGIEKTVLHIHGKVDLIDSIVLALDDYRNVYGRNPGTQAVLGNLLLTKSFVFLGYSFSDPPLTALLDHIKGLNGDGEYPQHWAIMPRPTNEATVRLELKHAYNIDPIFYENSDGTHSALVPLVEALAKAVAKFRSKNGQLVAANIIDAVFGADAVPLTRQQAYDRVHAIPLASHQGVLSERAEADHTNAWDYRIDAQVEILKEGFFEQAKDKFETLLAQLPAEAEPRLRYRLHANIGHALFQLERRDEVIPHYEQAYRYAPEKSDAKWMHALVAEIKKDFAEAVARAETLCKEDPTYARGHTIRIRCAPPEVSLLDLKRSTPRAIRRDAEVSASLAEAADSRRDWRASEAYARSAAKASPEWADASMLTGSAIMKREVGGDQPAVDYHVVPVNRGRIEEAHEWFTRAINMMAGRPCTPHLAVAYANRSGTRRMLGDDEGAHQDAAEAYRLLPTDVKVLSKYAHSLESRGAFDETINLVESSPDAQAYTPARFMRLLALARRKRDGDIDAAVLEAMELTKLSTLDDVEASDAHAILCNLYIEQRAPEKAIEHLRKLDTSVLPPGLRNARLAAYVFRFGSKQSEEAVAFLTDAVIAARSTAPWFARREIAHICAMMGQYRDAADILATIISPRLYSEETEEYLACLLRSKQYAGVREYCKALRSYSQYSEEAMRSECDALYFTGETKEAIDLLSDWLAWRPKDKRARLHRSGLYIARGEVNDATFDPALLPSIEEIQRPYEGIQVVHVLRHGPDFAAATEFAHKLARKYPDNEEVQFKFITTLMIGKRPNQLQADSKMVGMRHTVTLRSRSGDERRVIKLVNDQVRNPDEFLPDHDVAQTLVGKQVGENVTLGTDELVIESVLPTAALAARDAMEGFHLRFPNSKLIQKLSAKPPPDKPTNAREILGEEWWQIAMADDEANAQAFRLYQSGQVPLAMVARQRGRTVFETALHVVNSAALDVLSFPQLPGANPIPFINTCLTRLREARSVVIDATVLATLIAFDMAELLKEMPFAFIVPDSALQEVRKAKYDAEQGLGEHRAGLKDGEFFITETSPEVMNAWAMRLGKFVDAIQLASRVVGGTAREKLKVENKELLETTLGETAFDAIAVAAEENAVLWTDDQMLGRIANDLCGVPPIWTQALFYVASERTTKKWGSRALPEFLLHNFRGTILSILDVAWSLKESKWNLSDPRLAGVCDQLKKHACTPRNFEATRNMFVALWMHTPAKKRGRATRVIWWIMNLFDRDLVIKNIARPLYKPGVIPFSRTVPTWSRFRNVFRLWACSPDKVRKMLLES